MCVEESDEAKGFLYEERGFLQRWKGETPIKYTVKFNSRFQSFHLYNHICYIIQLNVLFTCLWPQNPSAGLWTTAGSGRCRFWIRSSGWVCGERRCTGEFSCSQLDQISGFRRRLTWSQSGDSVLKSETSRFAWWLERGRVSWRCPRSGTLRELQPRKQISVIMPPWFGI